MTSNPPSDELSWRRGKTLTPESPVPIHIPEPSNIPVLQNQIDPIFNLMSTHMEPPHALRNLTAMDHEMAHSRTSDEQRNSSADTSHGADLAAGAQTELRVDNSTGEDFAVSFGDADISVDQGHSDPSSLNRNQSSTLADERSTTMASFDQLPSPSLALLDPSPSSHALTRDFSHNAADPLTPTQDTLVTNGQSTTPDRDLKHDIEAAASRSDVSVTNGEVDFQALLDNIVTPKTEQPSTTDPSEAARRPEEPATVNVDIPPTIALPVPAGLPPRPPPQEKPAIHPNYVPGEDIRSYHFPQAHHATAHPNHSAQHSNSYRTPQPFGQPLATGAAPGANGLPPPPMASFQQPPKSQDQNMRSPTVQQPRHGGQGRNGNKAQIPIDDRDDNPAWVPDVQRKYEEFLDDERIYTAEGTWDKFPPGSRLFVGNLPSEVASKRDIFHIFHKYGRLAQISIKQAYGFVQYLDASACYAALQSEQGGRLKDRNMHLEISKPPKNARNAVSTAAGDSLRASYYRRSRSPDYGRRPPSRQMGQRNGGDRFSDFRDEPRRRDDYRPGRSPSPRGYRLRNEFRGGRERSPDRYHGGRSRSRSPPYMRGGQRYRSPSPRRRSVDDDDALPLPRRDARDVPDVQLLLIDDLDRAFVDYIEKAFRDRGLRCAKLSPPHVPLAAVVKRQILEGVQAVVKMYRPSQVTGKIPLQVFDRSGGIDQVRFEEYDDLDAHIAAELVIRSKATQAAQMAPKTSFPPQPYGAPLSAQQTQPQPPTSGQPNLANLITSLDTSALQKLLGAMQSPQLPLTPSNPVPNHSPGQSQDLSALLGGTNMQPVHPYQAAMQPGYPYPPQQQQQPTPQQYPYPGPNQAVPQAAPAYQQPQAGQQQHVQNIMEQLANWRQ